MKNQTINVSLFRPIMIVALAALLIITSFPKLAYAEMSVEGTTDATSGQSTDATDDKGVAAIDIQWEKYEPCNELAIEFEMSGQSVIAGKTTKHGPAAIWCDRTLSADEQNLLIASFRGNPGVGNPKSFEFIYGNAASAYGMTVFKSEGKVLFEAPHDWALLYVGAVTEKAPVEDPDLPPEDPKGGSKNPPAEDPDTPPLDPPVNPPKDVPEYIPDYVPEEPPVDEPPEEPPVDEPPVEPEPQPPVDETPIYVPPVIDPPVEPAPEPAPAPQPAPEPQPAPVPQPIVAPVPATPTRVLDIQPKTGVEDSLPAGVHVSSAGAGMLPAGPASLNKAPLANPAASLPNAADLTSLAAQNSDFVGWLSIDGTHISYPLMQSVGNPNYYLKHDFYKNASTSGTPYIGANSSLDSGNAIIYGHNMENGTMFSDLLLYQSEQFFREHSKILIQTAEKTSEYDIIAVFKEKVHYQDESNVFRYYNYVGDLSKADFDEYVKTIKQISLYDTSKTADYGDQLIALSTCSHLSKNGRFVVVAVKNSDPIN